MNNPQQPTSHDQPSLLDQIVAARDEAVDRVDRNANIEWKIKAYEVGKRIARDNRILISEEIWDALAVEGVTTHEPRAMGPVMKRLQADKIIEPTGDFMISPSPLGHGRPSRVWWSLIWTGKDQASENNDRRNHHDDGTIRNGKQR